MVDNYQVKIFCFLFVYSILSLTPCIARIEKSGIIDKNETWTAENSPYYLSDDLLVTENARLTISPGVSVIIGKPFHYNDHISQHDYIDSSSIAITIQGAFKCLGKMDKRITFFAESTGEKNFYWYGIKVVTQRSGEVEIGFTTLSNAFYGIQLHNSDALIRNCILEFNNIGIACSQISQPQIFNCIFTFNRTAAIQVNKSNPEIQNSIFINNSNIGLWSDKTSDITVSYNCFWGNVTNFTGCNPEFGIIQENKDKKKIPHDKYHNLFTDPIFKGSSAESLAIAFDLSIPTDTGSIKQKIISRLFHKNTKKKQPVLTNDSLKKPFDLSPYSPCLNAGNPHTSFKNLDESNNTLGIYGGKEIYQSKE